MKNWLRKIFRSGAERPAAEVEPAFGSTGRSDNGDTADKANRNIGSGIKGHAVNQRQFRERDGKSHKNFLTDDDADLMDDLIQRYADVRTKIFRLEKSWQKWTEPKR